MVWNIYIYIYGGREKWYEKVHVICLEERLWDYDVEKKKGKQVNLGDIFLKMKELVAFCLLLYASYIYSSGSQTWATLGSQEGLRFLDPHPQSFWLSSSGVGPDKICISNKFPDHADAAGPGNTLWEPLVYVFHKLNLGAFHLFLQSRIV